MPRRFEAESVVVALPRETTPCRCRVGRRQASPLRDASSVRGGVCCGRPPSRNDTVPVPGRATTSVAPTGCLVGSRRSLLWSPSLAKRHRAGAGTGDDKRRPYGMPRRFEAESVVVALPRETTPCRCRDGRRQASPLRHASSVRGGVCCGRPLSRNDTVPVPGRATTSVAPTACLVGSRRSLLWSPSLAKRHRAGAGTGDDKRRPYGMPRRFEAESIVRDTGACPRRRASPPRRRAHPSSR